MFFHLLYPLHRIPALSWLNVLRYVSTRTLLGMLTALGIALLAGPWFIRRLKAMQIGEKVREDGPASHKKKAGTPTMGGSLVLFAVVMGTLLWCDLTSPFVWPTLLVTVCFGGVGFLDDYYKLTRTKKGLSGRIRLAVEFGVAAVALGYLFLSHAYPDDMRYRIALPLVDFYRHPLTLGWNAWSSLILYIILGMIVVVGTSNAVNLTDGLDGLAIGPVIIASGAFLILTYGAGAVIKGFNLAEYLKIPYIPGSGELAIFCGALVGAGVGFLWYNAHPAEVFMGDVGALSLGGALGMLAVTTKNEFTLVILGGVFFIETLSVILQVAYFKYSGGKRIFLMTPIHHHFEKKGWAETKVVVRFWIVAFALALIALATLKVR
ncbi:MAG TPA: phospho-N-acetylmuramoyl-pentapeptide-transferase [Polyangia bacterium]|jgi:phospho-N-acetylmuramoyl-pentapeptide-transferase|nr:phospho-N-acetylmuramoyl-pentapeptide-transferase [Polyangia bacterium]